MPVSLEPQKMLIFWAPKVVRNWLLLHHFCLSRVLSIALCLSRLFSLTRCLSRPISILPLARARALSHSLSLSFSLSLSPSVLHASCLPFLSHLAPKVFGLKSVLSHIRFERHDTRKHALSKVAWSGDPQGSFPFKSIPF